MRYRKLDENDDYSFGHGNNDFYINEPMAVAQAALTRLQLFLGSWFLDTSDGTPWDTEILGTNTGGTRDLAIQERVLGTPNVSEITGYYSSVDKGTREFDAQMSLDTAYGPTTTVTSFNGSIYNAVTGST